MILTLILVKNNTLKPNIQVKNKIVYFWIKFIDTLFIDK